MYNQKPRTRPKGKSTFSPLHFVHCDLAGPIEPAAKDGFKYALCFIDEFTDINMIYFLKQKSDTFEAIEKFLVFESPCFNPRLHGKNASRKLIGQQPNLSGMHVCGSTCYAFIHNAKKLVVRNREGIFVGYDESSPSYL